MRILVIEDYAPVARLLGEGLRHAGYAVDLATDGQEGLALAESGPYDAMVLDLMLPGMDGLSILERLRRRHDAVGVVIVTGRHALDDRVKGLNLGADDYLIKPFAFEELLARLRAVIRRRYHACASTIRVGDLEVDTVARKVRRGSRPVALSAREYAVLEYLARRRDHVVTRAEIWDHVYDFASEPSSNVIDVYIGYLRRKIDAGHSTPLIQTRRGQGYVLGEKI